ncbi:hypothetical protein [Deinococcus metallilatus]|uniref:Transposase n=1 Tax=Deinococcus metallilatus TaxID=1211322 RepID=A0ABR6MVF4_9DEIO|nr:hypothetical protein [Deinococcus metallilatus]MBB5295659.1 hypothetical protein [Deinococcus metallilatus]
MDTTITRMPRSSSVTGQLAAVDRLHRHRHRTKVAWAAAHRLDVLGELSS